MQSYSHAYLYFVSEFDDDDDDDDDDDLQESNKEENIPESWNDNEEDLFDTLGNFKLHICVNGEKIGILFSF